MHIRRLVVLGLFTAVASVAHAQTQLVLLGTGNPNANPERSGPSLAIVVNGAAYLVDAGPGVVRRAEAARQRGVTALRQEALRIVFLTHLHSDHTLGLADLLFSPWVLGRTARLTVYGPLGTASMMRSLEEAYAVDVRRRQDGWQPQNSTGWRADTHEIEPGLVYADSNVRVTAFRVPHGNWPDAFGYRFDTADRSIVVSGDTRASDSVVDACRGCDVLVHEVYSDSGFRTLPPDWQRYHATFHTSASALAVLATRARPGLLILTHLLTWGDVPYDSILSEVRRAYRGRVRLGSDLDIY